MTDSGVMSFTMDRSCSCLSTKVNPLHTLGFVGAFVDVVGVADGIVLGENVVMGLVDGSKGSEGTFVGTIVTGVTVGGFVINMIGALVTGFVVG
jgi:hypothetical protein